MLLEERLKKSIAAHDSDEGHIVVAAIKTVPNLLRIDSLSQAG
jgi:hypothetical protein